MGEKVRHLRTNTEELALQDGSAKNAVDLDHERAARVLPILAHIIGSK
jgi:hypothetical protein